MRTLTYLGMALCGAIAVPEIAAAHGVTIQTQVSPRVEIQALYDDGQPIVEAQVRVYPPSNPENAQFSGQTDDQGRYQFTPTESGPWEVLVRQSGHGESLTLPVDLEGGSTPQPVSTEDGTKGTNLPQRLITIGAVIWGCIGTALYFKRRSA